MRMWPIMEQKWCVLGPGDINDGDIVTTTDGEISYAFIGYMALFLPVLYLVVNIPDFLWQQCISFSVTVKSWFQYRQQIWITIIHHIVTQQSARVSLPGRPVLSHIDYYMDRCLLTLSGSSGHLYISKRYCIMYAVRFGLSFIKSCNFEAPFESIYMYVTLII